MAYTFKHGDRPLDGITVQRAVGRGGFGEVYYAVADSGKQIALKYLRENPEVELRGIAHVMNLKSPHLITIYDVKQNTAGEPFVIMEYVSGPSLREMLLAEPGGMPVQKVAFLLAGICKGLSYLHERGIVHRDLKPANIFYDDGYVKIGDYGLSKHISVSRHSGQTVSVGTVHYMAPEIGSGNYTKAIDIYALGVILYEMLTGRLPFSGSSMGEVLMRHLRDNPDLTGVPAPFAQVIAKALAKNPEERYQDADELLAAVMQSGELSNDVASFDASALTQVPRSPEARDDRTVTASPRPTPPPLDARDAPGNWQDRLNGALEELPERLQHKVDRLTRKIEEKAHRLERKLGPGRVAARPSFARAPAAAGAGRDRLRDRLGRGILIVAVAALIALLLSFVHRDSEYFAERAFAVGLYILGGVAGVTIVQRRLLRTGTREHTLFDRLACAAIGGLFMLPACLFAYNNVGYKPAHYISDTAGVQQLADEASEVYDWSEQQNEENGNLTVEGPGVRVRTGRIPPPAVPRAPKTPWPHGGHFAPPKYDKSMALLIFSPLAAMALCDWRKRIAEAQRGTVSLGAAFWPALVGLIAAGIANANTYEITGAGVCAALSLLVQGAASMRAQAQFAQARAAAVAGVNPPPPPPLPAAPPPPAGADAAASAPTPAGGAAAPTPAVARRVEPLEPLGAPEVVEAAHPSFVGRATRSGVCLIGKLLLLAGVFLVVAQAVPQAAELHLGSRERFVPLNITRSVPARAGSAALVMGAIVLVLARRRQGGRVLVRTLAGCALIGLGAAAAMSKAGPALSQLVNDPGVDTLLREAVWRPLLFTVAPPLVLGLVLVFWPQRDPRRPIVV